MSNVILFNLTTVLFGVASALYLGALYAKNEKISVAGTWVCMIAAVVSTAALGVRWYESYQMGIGRIPVTNLYESLVFFAWSVNLFSLIVVTGVEGVSDAAGTIRRFFVSIDLYRLLGATIRLRPGGRAIPPLPIVTMDAGSGSNKKGGLPRPLIMLSVVVLLLESLPSVTYQPHQPTPQKEQREGFGDMRDRHILWNKRDPHIVDRRGVVAGHRRLVSTILQTGKHDRIRTGAGRTRLGGDGNRVGHTTD